MTLTTGPGRFTALRACLSFFLGLSLAMRAQLAGFTSFEIAAFASQIEGPFAVTFPAREGVLYAQKFSSFVVSDGAPFLVSQEAPLEPGLPCLPIADLTAYQVASALNHQAFQQRLKETHPPAPLYLEEPNVKPMSSQAMDITIARRR